MHSRLLIIQVIVWGSCMETSGFEWEKIKLPIQVPTSLWKVTFVKFSFNAVSCFFHVQNIWEHIALKQVPNSVGRFVGCYCPLYPVVEFYFYLFLVFTPESQLCKVCNAIGVNSHRNDSCTGIV